MNKDVMNLYVGKVIKVDRGGPESRIGKLMAVFEDYFVLLTESDGIVYYKTNHIRSVTESARDQIKLNLAENMEFKSADNFLKLLESIKYQWVKINRGGPESLEGVLSDADKDFCSLIVKEEIVRFSMKHVRNISYGVKMDKAKNENSND